jgi:ketose-bisphosphate aldolase
MLVSVRSIVKQARKGNYTVAALDCPNSECLHAIVGAAEAMRAPVIVMTTKKDMEYAGIEETLALVSAVAKKAKVPVGLHLDHGREFATVKKAIDAGYSSVMVDGSLLSYAQNVALTKKVVAYAHKRNVYVQAELGSMLEHEFSKNPRLRVKDLSQLYTDPSQAKDFVQKTGTDTLAIAIGNLHGIMKYRIKNPRLDLSRLKKIRTMISVPLIMHGSSKIPDSTLRKIMQSGVSVFNFRTEYFMAYTRGIRVVLRKDPEEVDPRVYGAVAIEYAKRDICDKIKVLGSKNKARGAK